MTHRKVTQSFVSMVKIITLRIGKTLTHTLRYREENKNTHAQQTNTQTYSTQLYDEPNSWILKNMTRLHSIC